MRAMEFIDPVYAPDDNPMIILQLARKRWQKLAK